MKEALDIKDLMDTFDTKIDEAKADTKFIHKKGNDNGLDTNAAISGIFDFRNATILVSTPAL